MHSRKKKPKESVLRDRIITILWGVFTALVVFLFFAVRFLMDNWAQMSADELLYHLKSTVDGTNPEMIRDAMLCYALPAAALTAILWGALWLLRQKPKDRAVYMRGILVAEIASLLLIKGELDREIGLTDYIKWNVLGYESTFIEDNYVDPGSVEITFPEKKRNLIFLFLESTEMTFADPEHGGAFEKNLIPELTELALENEDFSGEGSVLNGGISLPGSDWTVGAMFAMATGAPLKVPINGNMILEKEHFFPEMKSLGTVLREEGYNQELLIGSKALFGGRDVFYKGHGNFDIRDYNYAVNHGRIPEDYYVFWGYEDEKLFQFAREDLQELAAKGKPFNLTMLTVDTHFEDGYRCRLCRDEFGEQYADSFACTSRQVTEFVKWVQQQDFYENTTIVICGDHPTMDRDFCLNVPDDYLRKTYTVVINGVSPKGDAGTRSFREYSTMDLFPTTLSAMNVMIEGDRLGMGTDLYSGTETLVEKYGLEKCRSELLMPSSFMNEMSGIRITENILEEAAGYVWIKTDDTQPGKVTISLWGTGGYLNINSVKGMELVVTDHRTGEEKTYRISPVYESESDPNQYVFSAEHDLNGSTLEDLEAVFYITTEDFEHYKIADLEHNLKNE